MSLRPFRNSDSTVTVSIYDPAFDHEKFSELTKEDHQKIVAELWKNPASFREHYPKKDGKEWTVFEIGVVPIETLVRIDDECLGKDGTLSGEGKLRCFLHGVRSIKPWSDKIPTKMVNGIDFVDQDWLRSTFIRGLHQIALDVGATIWRWNHLMEAEVKN